MVVELFSIGTLIAVQFVRIAPFWAAGILVGSAVSVFLAGALAAAVAGVDASKRGVLPLFIAVVLGAASPVCMYGTIPILASLGRRGVPQYLLAAFMVSSILINPNLFVFSFALGAPLAVTRLVTCLAVAAAAGACVRVFFRNASLFDFGRLGEDPKHRSRAPTALQYLRSVGRGVVKTGPYLLGGIVLTALMDQYFPRDWLEALFHGNRGLGVLLAATVGVPIYVCGGGTIPLLKYWLGAGMSPGSAIAFMVSGPATKLTNLGAVKIVLGMRNFALYIAFCLCLAVISGLAVDGLGGLVGWIPAGWTAAAWRAGP